MQADTESAKRFYSDCLNYEQPSEQSTSLAGVDSFTVPHLVSNRFSGCKRCRIVHDPVLKRSYPVDDDGRILTRNQFCDVISEINQFYDDGPSDAEILAANRKRFALSMLDSLDCDSDFIPVVPGTVYVVTAEHGMCKIGRTENLRGRLQQLSNASPFEIKVICAFETAHSQWLERGLHLRYRRFRVRLEWFKLPDESIDELKALAELYENADPT